MPPARVESFLLAPVQSGKHLVSCERDNAASYRGVMYHSPDHVFQQTRLLATVGRSTHLAVHVFAKKRLVASAAHEFL